jgi:hypothetical protein
MKNGGNKKCQRLNEKIDHLSVINDEISILNMEQFIEICPLRLKMCGYAYLLHTDKLQRADAS